MIDAAKGASAHRIIAVMPWYGYSRQDKKSAPREPISARLVARMVETAGADRVLTMHLHAGQVQGFFQVPVDHLIARPMLTQYFLDKFVEDEYVAVSPDAGRAKLAEKFAGELGVRPAFLTKNRPEHNIAEAGYVVGDVAGKTAILVDDMIDTAGTLIEAARVVREAGATKVYAAATHGVFSGPAFDRLAGPEIEEIVVTDTIPLGPEAPDKIRVLSVADILARSIRSIFTDGSVSELFAGDNQLF
jgi:ribose-phosphate pyrophosphokinase